VIEQTTGDKPRTAAIRSPWPVAAILASLLAIAAAVLVPQVLPRDDLLNLLFRVCLFISLAQSWNILAGFTGQTSLGHAAFFGTGALITRTLWVGGMPFPLALALGGLAAAAFAMIIGGPTFRLRGAYFAIGTLGVAEVLRITVARQFPLITSLPGSEIAGYDLGARYYLALGLAVAVTVTAAALRHSWVGLGLEAVREDEDAARATGVWVMAHKLLALAISSFFAGLAGGVFAFQQVSYYPAAPFGPAWTFDALLITYIGGLGTIVGPLIGALFFIIVQEQLALNLAAGHQIIFGVLFIIVVLVFPGGLVEGWRWLQRKSRRSRVQSPKSG
jgi:branched-chain amino acid transport system permease protein